MSKSARNKDPQAQPEKLGGKAIDNAERLDLMEYLKGL
mgnify:CR=1 FL=1